MSRAVLCAGALSVSDDDHLRPDRAEKCRGAGVVERAMTIDCIDCHRADLIDRTNEFELTLPVEIAQARKLEVAVCEREPHHALVFRRGGFHLLVIGAKRIGAAAVNRICDYRTL